MQTMEGPWRALLMQGSTQILHFLWPDSNENNHSSGTKDGIDPKPGSKFEFVHCLKVYKKWPIWTIKEPWQAFFVQRSPLRASFLLPNINEMSLSDQHGKRFILVFSP